MFSVVQCKLKKKEFHIEQWSIAGLLERPIFFPLKRLVTFIWKKSWQAVQESETGLSFFPIC